MRLYFGTPYKISGKIEPRPYRNAKGNEGNFVFATPHRNAAIAYAFKPTDPNLQTSPLLVPEVQQQEAGSENPYAMIIGADYNLYLRGLSLTGNLYTVPPDHFHPVASPQGEYVSSENIPVTECEHNIVSLKSTLGRNFDILFANQGKDFFSFLDSMIRAHPLEEFGRLITDQKTLEQAVSEGILYKIDDQEIISRSGTSS